jgi:hypothetical protein
MWRMSKMYLTMRIVFLNVNCLIVLKLPVDSLFSSNSRTVMHKGPLCVDLPDGCAAGAA